jgi:Ca-activated chloride channel homolog
MKRRALLSTAFLTVLCISGYITIARVSKTRGLGLTASASSSRTAGALQVVSPEKGVVGVCPLKHTDVKAEISGFISRVVVTQQFDNPFKEKIEAVYTFPLPQNAAVDDMTMTIGDRTVRGRIKRREEARAVYEAARAAGNVASLLDQERPNIFTQSVANIMPGERVNVTISYVETLKYDEGSYEFVFPMVVGPRYIPGSPAGKHGGGRAQDTDRVPDASRITPPVAPEATRAGHDISLEIALDAAVPIDGLKSVLHDIDLERPTNHSAFVSLKDKAVIPNKDFVLKYDVAGKLIEDAILTHRNEQPGDGFFTLILQPPERVNAQDVMPKELVFVLDTSGSMSGFPIGKAKESMRLALDGLNPQDTFNLITFAGDTSILFPEPVKATRENLAKAKAFLESRSGAGGTEMMKAIRAALDPSDAQNHVRIVCFMTDGYVGNDMEIIAEVQKHPNARVFAFGIGNSVNRFLLDKMSEEGRGEVEYVSLSDDGSAAAKRFHDRVRNPLLTDLSIDWSGLPVTYVYPKRLPDLFSAKPVVVSGRYTSGARGVIKLKGQTAGRDFTRDVAVELPDREPRHDALSSLWARTRIDDLMSQDYNGIQNGNTRDDLREAIIELGMKFRLMTQFTSFVAVEEMTVTDAGVPRRIEVPVEMPEGVSRRGVFGEEKEQGALTRKAIAALPMQARTPPSVVSESVSVQAADASVVSSTSPSSPKIKTKDGATPSRGNNRQASKGGSGSGSGSGVGPGRGYNMGGGSPRLGGGSGSGQPAKELSPEEKQRRALLAKTTPAIAALIQRLKKNDSTPAAEEAKFVRNGKAELQVWLTEKSPETLRQLKQLGFEVVLEPKTQKLIIGRIAIEKLLALVNLTSVTYVSPMKSS